jgi:hypothetical protein
VTQPRSILPVVGGALGKRLTAMALVHGSRPVALVPAQCIACGMSVVGGGSSRNASL